MLLFYVGENRYAVNCSDILRIIPKITLKEVPYAVRYVAGFLNLAGKPIPVVDFCQLIEQREAKNSLNSRIILIKDVYSHSERVVGILGEKVGEIINLSPDQFSRTEFPLYHFPYLDRVYSDDQGIIQYINIVEFFRFLSAEIFKAVGKEHHEP
jgi:chemotaxis-related protein WspB